MKILTLLLFSIGVFAQDTIPDMSRDTLIKISFVRTGAKIDLRYERFNSIISNRQLIEWLLPLLKEIYKKEEDESKFIRN